MIELFRLGLMVMSAQSGQSGDQLFKGRYQSGAVAQREQPVTGRRPLPPFDYQLRSVSNTSVSGRVTAD